ncbi:pheromone-processing carboxypeptidase KEX1-like [Humulus lupulus]|uniref:pheromone-processing carboxypeptidase KEX1-like n=1 Tax=Humulus lupulus TaxID=3486 RepID=UPI002B411462|nr:pheromone-processing carboxypeptidase KEX1-like [Humulus lupulus]
MQAQLSRIETSQKVLISEVDSIKTIVNGLSSHFDSSILKLHELILSHILGKQKKAMHDESNVVELDSEKVRDKEDEVSTDCVIEEKSDDEEDEKDDDEEDDDKDEEEEEGEDEDEDESDEENNGFDHDEDADADDDPIGEEENSEDREKE